MWKAAHFELHVTNPISEEKTSRNTHQIVYLSTCMIDSNKNVHSFSNTKKKIRIISNPAGNLMSQKARSRRNRKPIYKITLTQVNTK